MDDRLADAFDAGKLFVQKDRAVRDATPAGLMDAIRERDAAFHELVVAVGECECTTSGDIGGNR